MAVVSRSSGSGWQIAGILSLLAVAAPSAQAQRAPMATAAADWREAVPAVSPVAAATWMKLLSDNGRLPKRERLIVLDADGAVLAQVDGEERSVRVPADLSDQLCSQAIGATLIHNHPEQASFSAADIEVLARAGVRRVVAISADGTTFEAEAGSSFSNGWAVRLRSELPKRVHARVVEEAARFGASLNLLSLHEAHLTGVVLRRLGVLDYRVSPSLTTRVAYDRYRDIFDRIVDAETTAAVTTTAQSGR